MKTICTDKAPAAIGPYSQGKVINGIVYLSGQIPLDAATGAVVGTNIMEQTAVVLNNISALLTETESDFDHVIKTTCFLADMNDFAEFNQLYAEKFTSKPARSCVAVKGLPKNVLIEVEVMAQVK